MARSEITGLQLRALAYIADYQQREGAPPTRRQLCELMGWTAPATAQRMVDVLVKKGLIQRVAERHGIIRVTALGASVLTDQVAA